MKVYAVKIYNKINACISAFEAADTDRKLVRQVDTGIRKLHNMSKKYQYKYTQTSLESGHYSKNPVRRFISYMKSWNANRKRLLGLQK